LLLYRFSPSPHDNSADAFSGNGGLKYGRRWNNKGTGIVYCSTTTSLALSEVLVHVNDQIPSSIPLFVADVPDSLIGEFPRVNLPIDWNTHPPSASTRNIGSAWVQSLGSVGLLVPSIVVPLEFNCLINPVHPDFNQKWIQGPFDFPVDPRLLEFTKRPSL
jgi:RES domain-containing protein